MPILPREIDLNPGDFFQRPIDDRQFKWWERCEKKVMRYLRQLGVSFLRTQYSKTLRVAEWANQTILHPHV